MGGVQVLARVDTAALAAQRFPEKQMRAGCSGASGQRDSLSIASKKSSSASRLDAVRARDRASMPLAHSVPAAWVRSLSRSSASAASSSLPHRLAASTSSGTDHTASANSSRALALSA